MATRFCPRRTTFAARLQCTKKRQQYQHPRHHSATNYTQSSRTDVDAFEVSCGSAGTVTVDILNADLLSAPSTPLIIYLPSTGILSQPFHTPQSPRLLFDTSPARSILSKWPIARINYRWNSQQNPSLNSSQLATHAFPTPLHDVLHAYTWLTTSFLPSVSSNLTTDSSPLRSPSPYASASSQAVRRQSLRPLLIYGSFLGGTLASSLSLTETRTHPVGSTIKGVIIRNGIFDWTHVATSRPSSPAPKASDDPPPLITGRDEYDIDTLHTLKTHLFTTPSSAFDPFASPLLFFRSPGLSIPSYFPGTAPSTRPPSAHDPALLDGLSISEEELTSLRANASSSPHPTSQGSDDEVVTTTRRSALRFPPRDSGLRIARSLFLTASASQADAKIASKRRGRAKAERRPGEEMHRQAEEMAKVMRRSLLTYEFKDRAVWDEDGDPHALSRERVRLHELGVDEDGREEAAAVEEWIDGLGLE